MKKIVFVLMIAAAALVACQSTPKATPAAEPQKTVAPAPAAPAATTTPAVVPETPAPVADPSTIVAADSGFSPLAQSPHNYLSFSLHFGQPQKIRGWVVDMVDASGTVVHSVKDQAPQLPPTLAWDGNGDDGKLAPEGTYRAKLSVDYGDQGGVVAVQSDPFLLDITPPSGTITVSPQPFEPGDPNILVNPPLVTINVQVVPGAAPVATWRLAVLASDGTRFMDFISEDHKDNTVAWNGRAQNNAALTAGASYDLAAQVFDRYGNVGNLKGVLTVAAPAVAEAAPAEEPKTAEPQPVAAPVTVSLDGKLIASTQIYFPAYSADLAKVSPAKQASNEQSLGVLAGALKSAPGNRIKVIGHANKVFWQDKVKGDREQEMTLIPLSKARADAVRGALVSLGLPSDEFDLDGVGAEGALAPFGDLVNNWKNRRVEFVVEPKNTP